MSIRSALTKSWLIVRLLIVCAGVFGLSPAVFPDFSTPAIAGDLQCAPVQNACGCAACGCSTPQLPTCPAGQSLYGDYCLPSCPGGFIRYPGMPGVCMPPCHHGCPTGYDQVPMPQCPQGFHRDLTNPDQCLQDPGVIDYQGQCPYGTDWAPETGRCEVICPQGTFRNEQGLCESYYGRECPKDYGRDPESGKCLPPGTWPVDYQWICLPQCPTGTYRDINHPTRCVPPRTECPDNYENIQGRCLPVCEEGTARDNYGYCVPTNQCPDGTIQNIRGQCVEQQCPEGTEKLRGQCVPVCDEGWTRNQQGRCTPPDDGCSQGQEKVRGQCVPVCKQGLTRDQNGRCVPPVKECGQGQRLNPQTNQCERIKTCPKNTVYNAKRNKCEPVQRPCGQDEVRDRNGRCVPVNNEPQCGDGEILDRAGRCIPVNDEPQCGRNEVLDKNGRCVPVRNDPVCNSGEVIGPNGDCIPVRIIPRGCKEGYYFDLKRGACLPVRQQQEPTPADPQEPPVIRKIPDAQLRPGVIDKLLQDGGAQGQGRSNNSQCPEGSFLAKNGLCQVIQ